MTDFGPAIERGCSIWDASEKRPAWLADDVATDFRHDDGEWFGSGPAGNLPFWGEVDQICLPADHIAYRVKSWNDAHPDEVPFYPWQGGDDAPGDWDGEAYLCRDGKTYFMNGYDWKFGTNAYAETASWDRIGYRRKPQPAPQVEAPDWSRPIEAYHPDGRVVAVALDQNMQQPDDDGEYSIYSRPEWNAARFYKADGTPYKGYGSWRIRNVAASPDLTAIAQEAAKAAGGVFVPWMTATDARRAWSRAEGETLAWPDKAVAMCRDLGIIRPEPTRAERIHASLPHISVADVEAVLGLAKGA